METLEEIRDRKIKEARRKIIGMAICKYLQDGNEPFTIRYEKKE